MPSRSSRRGSSPLLQGSSIEGDEKGDVANATSPFSFPRFPIFSRRHADKAVESDLEIIRVVVAAPERDFGDCRVSREQEVLRFRHAAMDHVLDR